MDNKTFIDTLGKRINADRQETSEMLGAFCEVITECALDGDSVTFPGFGNFEPRKRNEWVSVHPSTGKRMLIPPKITLSFKPSTLLKQKVRHHE